MFLLKVSGVFVIFWVFVLPLLVFIGFYISIEVIEASVGYYVSIGLLVLYWCGLFAWLTAPGLIFDFQLDNDLLSAIHKLFLIVSGVYVITMVYALVDIGYFLFSDIPDSEIEPPTGYGFLPSFQLLFIITAFFYVLFNGWLIAKIRSNDSVQLKDAIGYSLMYIFPMQMISLPKIWKEILDQRR